MSNPFLGEIRAFSFAYAPTGWLQCNGQILPINQYQALFALLGTTYGGNGVQNFQLPDLRGRVALHVGNGLQQGSIQGEEVVTLSTAQLPAHKHVVNAANNGTTNGSNIPGPGVIPGSGSGNNAAVLIYGNGAANVALAPLAANGSGQPHENRMPSLVMNYCIAMSGIFPSRN
jgi:microcystin-dependent protein